MLFDGLVVHVCEPPVQVDVLQAAVQKAQRHWRAIVHRLQLRQPLRGESFQVAVGQVFPTKRSGGGPFSLRGDDGCKFPRRHRAPIKPALRVIASQPQQHIGLLLGLYSFRNCRQSETLAHADNRRDDLSAVPALSHGTHEALVHLERIERHGLELAQARIPGAEIV